MYATAVILTESGFMYTNDESSLLYLNRDLRRKFSVISDNMIRICNKKAMKQDYGIL